MSNTGRGTVKQLEWLCVHACMSVCECVCVDCNTVAVYPGLSSKQLVPICFFFYSCGLWLRERGALACGVWVWTSSGEVCTAGVCVCVWMWFMASECSCVYMWFRTRLVYVCAYWFMSVRPCVWIMHVCVCIWPALHPACLCGVTVRAQECLAVTNNHIIYLHFNIDTQSYVTANISRSTLPPSYCLHKLSHDAVCSKSDSLRKSVQSFHLLFM